MSILTMVHYYQHTYNTIQKYFEWYDTSKSKYDSHVTIYESKPKKHNANHTNSMLKKLA